MSNTLFLRNVAQVALFQNEIRGQLFAAHWENARPYDHWKPWCHADVVVQEASRLPVIGRNFWVPRDSYELTSHELLDVVGHRMEGYARLGIVFGAENVPLFQHLLDIDGDFRGIPDYVREAYEQYEKGSSAGKQNDYYHDLYLKLSALDQDHIRFVAGREEIYGRKELLRDLRDIKDAMRTYVSQPDFMGASL